jgi:hypothetical protein
MSPRQSGGLGLIFGREDGLNGSLVATYVSSRFLNKSNSVAVGGYATLDASIGCKVGRFAVRFGGYNLSDRHDAVSESDLHEAVTVTGTAGYYRLPGRTLRLAVTTRM